MKQFLASLILVPAWLYCVATALVAYSGWTLIDRGYSLAGVAVCFLCGTLIRNGYAAFSKPPLKPDQDHVIIVPLK